MVLIRIDRDMVIEELYTLRGLIPVEEEAARRKLDEIVNFIANAVIDDRQAQFPRTSIRRG